MFTEKLSKSELYYLLKLATSESSFIFDNTLYKQNYGPTRDFSLEPILANAFLCYYRNFWLDNYPLEFKPVVQRRHVEHVFVLFKSKEYLLSFARYMNTRPINLKFTFDLGHNESFFQMLRLLVELTDFSTFSEDFLNLTKQLLF